MTWIESGEQGNFGGAWNEVKDTLLIFAESLRRVTPARMDSFVPDSVVDEKNC